MRPRSAAIPLPTTTRTIAALRTSATSTGARSSVRSPRRWFASWHPPRCWMRDARSGARSASGARGRGVRRRRVGVGDRPPGPGCSRSSAPAGFARGSAPSEIRPHHLHRGHRAHPGTVFRAVGEPLRRHRPPVAVDVTARLRRSSPMSTCNPRMSGRLVWPSSASSATSTSTPPSSPHGLPCSHVETKPSADRPPVRTSVVPPHRGGRRAAPSGADPPAAARGSVRRERTDRDRQRLQRVGEELLTERDRLAAGEAQLGTALGRWQASRTSCGAMSSLCTISSDSDALPSGASPRYLQLRTTIGRRIRGLLPRQP